MMDKTSLASYTGRDWQTIICSQAILHHFTLGSVRIMLRQKEGLLYKKVKKEIILFRKLDSNGLIHTVCSNSVD